jgi:hypothetical protein
MGGNVAHGEMRNAYKIFVGKPEGKRLLGRPSRRREDNIKMDLREIVLEGVDWIHTAHGNKTSGFKDGGKFFD